MKGNICQNEMNLSPSTNIDEKLTNVNENSIKITKNDSPKKPLNDTIQKRCYKCNQIKSIIEFAKSKKRKDGLQGKCKSCQKKYRSETKHISAAYYKIYKEKNNEKLNIYLRTYGKKYREINKEYRRVREKQLRNKSINYRISGNLRSRISKYIKKNKKVGSVVRDLGCTINELKTYLELKFQDGMTWNNYGEWHIDHIKPLASFDLTDRKQLLEACHYTNLQPLWAEDNLSKGSKNIGADGGTRTRNPEGEGF